jgi:Aspartyl protease/PDZ domain
MVPMRPMAAFLSLATCCALSGASPPRGAETGGAVLPQAAEIVARWRQAVHAAPGAAGAYAVALTTSNQDGIEGRIEERLTRDDPQGTGGPAEEFGVYRALAKRPLDETDTVVTARPGAPEWTGVERDWNGWLRDLRGREMLRLRAAVVETRAILFGPGDEWNEAEVSRSGDGDAYVLRLLPRGATAPAGPPSRSGRAAESAASVAFVLDAATMRPIRSVRAGSEDGDVTTAYDRFEALGPGPLLTPRAGRVSETGKPDFSWTRDGVRFAAAPARKAFAAPWPGPADTRLAADAPPIPFDFDSAHIILKVSVNGRPPLGFILDTGADENCIQSTRLADFGLTTYAKSAATGGGGETEYGYAKGATFTLPGVTVRDQHVAVVDQTGLERALGVPLGGLLGYDFLSRFVVEIDYAKKLMTLHDPARFTYSGPGAVVPVVFDHGIPHTDGTITVAGRDLPAYLVIDFGAAETMTLTSPFVKEHDLLALAQTNAQVNAPSLANQFFSQTNVRGRVERLALGAPPLVAESIPINLSRNTSGAYASPNFAGTVGQGIDRRYHVFLDYARSRVIFEPTAEARQPFPEKQTYGLTLLASGDDLRTYTVSAVRPGSPAEADGLQKDDVVTRFDDRAASGFTLSELRAWLNRSGERHRFEVKRGGGTVTIPVEVRLVSLDAK